LGLGKDPSLKSFVFTLKNPHNIPALRFALKADKNDLAIKCNSECGLYFYDIRVSDNCNADSNSNARNFGHSYINDTGLNGKTLFTGSDSFEVKEIEVFGIKDLYNLNAEAELLKDFYNAVFSLVKRPAPGESTD
jgi:hypothetical protein